MRNSAGSVLAAILCASLIVTPSLPAEVRVNSRVGGACAPTCDQAEPSVAVAGATVVIGFNDTRYPGAVSGYAYSMDGGATWTDGSPLPLAGDGDQTFGDPALVACAGAFYYASLYFRPGVGSAVSVSRGVVIGGQLVWEDPQVAASAIAFDVAGRDRLDKEYIACDRATGSLYAGYTRVVGGLDGKERIEVVRSTTGGSSWISPTIVGLPARRGGRLGALPAVGADGTLYVVWADIVKGRTRSCELAVSHDGGTTFPVRKRIPGCRCRPAPGTQFQLPVLAADLRTPGLLYVAYAAGDHGHGEIFVTRSTTGGRTFRRPVRVTEKGLGIDQFMPWIALDPVDGEVTVVWYDRRLPPRNASLDVFFAQSADGRRFGPNMRLTSTSTDAERVGVRVRDYLNVVSDGTRTYVAWADGRNGDYDIYFTKIGKGTR